MNDIFVSESSLERTLPEVDGSFVDLGGERFYRVQNYDAMPPFLLSLVSASDHWLFLSSNGALTAGRKGPDHALFPYYTDDRIHDSQHQTGSKTILRVTRGGKTSLWEPFSQRYQGLYGLKRNLYKSVYGNKVLFEETNRELDLTFRCEWMNSDRWGFVRRGVLVNNSEEPAAIDLLDGIQNLLPCGLDRRFQLEYSTLADGYKRTELVPETGLALFRLSSIPVDKAEPSEALCVNLAWSTGLSQAKRLLSAGQFEGFRRGLSLHQENDVRGQRGAYMLNASLELDSRAQKEWLIVAEVDQDASKVRALNRCILETPDLGCRVLADVEQGTRDLIHIVASADGLQLTGDESSCRRHFSNVLFNVMRGGLPEDGYVISREDLRAFLGRANAEVARREDSFLQALPDRLHLADLKRRAAGTGDPDLARLVHEYLPLTFSRRHGDPSRPWNIFSIRLKDASGHKLLDYEGNWRDIFQNWEALGHSFPGFIESMIAKFLDCSTADGYNPYRIMRDGFEWETIDPDDAWSFIGYWGDHQVIYLLKLLEASHRFRPGQLSGMLGQKLFSYADVPYRIKPYEDLIARPRDTIRFDQAAHRETMERAARLGADGKSLMGADGPVRSNLAEKLLLVALTRLTNFIPEGGVWMNTQRPEWNDANNALVGYGVSVVTLCYLRRYLAFCRDLFQAGEEGGWEVTSEIGQLLHSVEEVLRRHAGYLGAPVTPGERKRMLDALGRAGSEYRAAIYSHGFTGDTATITPEQVRAFCDLALRHVDHSIQANRRDDGLYHAYNLMKVEGDGIDLRNLHLMLEGQVAAISSGALTSEQVLVLLDALRASPLYRVDQGSYMLYPDRVLPRFLDKNNVPESSHSRSDLLTAMLRSGDERIVARDIEGMVHFSASFRNAELLREALEGLSEGPYRDLVARESHLILGIYEQVFDHQSFTGRSGSFYKYEGLGCIYWHMVSKLLLAVDEARGRTAPDDAATLSRLNAHYQAIREGIGVHKSPADYGAIPTDPYSHTPGFAGAQQPGMTGQVKEDCLTRLSETGLQITAGRLRFRPELVSESEFLSKHGILRYVDVHGQEASLPLVPGSLAFTFCQVPVVVRREGPPRILVVRRDGAVKETLGLELDVPASTALFGRDGSIRSLEVFLGRG
ncbi:MAG: hypothetical protein HY014_09360 [Acidobacteria bacterium]|nr:hypothetical protein [Acidobacteriota bacterium]MBI3488362.1 hypothetical protein [Acidobacteriota bacterium]